MTTNDDNTGLTVAMLGGGALLLWLLLRGRGKRTGKGGDGDRRISGGTEANLKVLLRSGDRIEIDGVAVDLATAVARARAARMVELYPTDARHGWVETVKGVLAAAGVVASTLEKVLHT